MEGRRQAASDTRRADRAPAKRQPATKPAPAPGVSQLVALQRLAGNSTTLYFLKESRLDARPPAVMLRVQRDIAPGQPLPDVAAIGQQRVEKRLNERERSTRIASGFATTLVETAGDNDLVKAILTERRDFVDGLYRKMFTRQHRDDPGTVQQLVQTKLDELVPTLMEAVVVQTELWALGSLTPGLTPKMAKDAMAAKFPPLRPGEAQPKEWLAGEIIGAADKRNADAVEAQLPQDAAVEWQRIASRAEGASFGQALSKTEKAAFAAELKLLPSLASIARAHGGDKDALKMTAAAGWLGGGFLSDDIEEVDQDDDKKPIKPKYLYRTAVDDGTFRKNVFQADKMIRTLVEPEVLGLLARPKIKVHPMKQSQFRAFQIQGEVHLAADEPVPIMVHEVGHYLEDAGAVESWADIQRLIGKRHELAGGGANTERGPAGLKNEGRYRGEYPVTGKYTSKAYDTGSTEVMSMSLEYLARPSTFETLIQKDPVQAATVLRALQPRAYAARAGLRPFDKYLPS